MLSSAKNNKDQQKNKSQPIELFLDNLKLGLWRFSNELLIEIEYFSIISN